jgi:hypothetical protein
MNDREFAERWRKIGERLGSPERIAKAMKLVHDLLWLETNKPDDYAAMLKTLEKLERKGKRR